MTSMEFKGLTGETLTKLPGEIDGESFTIKDLTDCSVYLLDYTSDIEVENCTNCRLFFGPVDGQALFTECKGCQVAVVAKLFKATGCEDCEFGLYSSNKPTIAHCKALRFSVFMGAYPGLSKHLTEAQLDPRRNLWDQVQDSTDAEGGPNFEILDAEEYWEVPIEGAGVPDNPIPGPGGRMYAPSGGAPEPAPSGGQALDAAAFSATFSGSVENGDTPTAAAFPRENEAPLTAGANSKLAEVQKAVRARLAAQEKEEMEGKTSTMQKANTFLEKFYKERHAKTEAKKKQNREAEKAAKVSGPEGTGHWERTISLIDFSNVRPAGSDLSRLKSVLFAAKGRDAKAAA